MRVRKQGCWSLLSEVVLPSRPGALANEGNYEAVAVVKEGLTVKPVNGH